MLNRTVEQAVFEFILKKANGKNINGEYVPTEKNGLVQSLFETLGFKKIISDYLFNAGVVFFELEEGINKFSREVE